MKKAILLSSVFAAGAVFATVTVDSTADIGALGVGMPKRATLIAVPFLGDGAEGAIKVADMVNLTELNVGSKLYAPNGSGAYNVWELKLNGKNEKYWDPADKTVIIGKDGTVTEGSTPEANSVDSTRGEAFWLEPKGDETATACYLLGIPASADGQSTAVANKWNLIGNTSGSAITLPSTGFVTGDQVGIPQSNGKLMIISWKSGTGWWIREKGVPTETTVTIHPGQGIWFYAKGSDRTINWSPAKDS